MRSSRASRLSRKVASRAGSGSESALTRCAAASCSTTGPPRSMVVRAAAKRWIRDSSARIQPVRSPAQCDLLREPMETTAGLKAASGVDGDAVEVQLPQCLVHDEDGAGCGGGADQPAPLGIGHQAAGGVVEVRDHVGHGGPLLHQCGLEGVQVPARTCPGMRPGGCRVGGGHGHGHQPAARGPDGIDARWGSWGAPPGPCRTGRPGCGARCSARAARRTSPESAARWWARRPPNSAAAMASLSGCTPRAS